MAQTHNPDHDAPARHRAREIDAPELADHRDGPAHPDVDVMRPRVLADHEVNPRLVDAAPRPNDVALVLGTGGPIVDPETGRPFLPAGAEPDPRYPSPSTRRRAEIQAEGHERAAAALRAHADAPPTPADPRNPSADADLPAHARRT